MAKRPEVPKHLAKVHARKLLERQEQADLYQKGLQDAAKFFAAGSFFPVDVAEGFTQGAFTPPASYKAAMMRPPVPSDYQIDEKTGKPVFKGKPPVANPEYKGTTEHVGKQLGVDIADPGGLAPQVFSPDPFSKIHALGILGKAGLEGLGGLGALYGGLKKVGKADAINPLVKEAKKYKSAEEFKARGFDSILKDVRGIERDSEVIIPTNKVEIKWKDDYQNALETAKKEYNPETAEPVDFIYDFKKDKYILDDGHNRFVSAQRNNQPIKGKIQQIEGNLEELADLYSKEKGISIAEIWEEAQKPGPIFTSPGKSAAADISKETIPANKVKNQLEGRGVSKDEMEWTGFNDWIKTKKGEVSKAEIEEFFEQNQIQVQEVVKGAEYRLTELPEGYSIKPLSGNPEAKFALETPEGTGKALPYAEDEAEALDAAFDYLEEMHPDPRNQSVRYPQKDLQLPGGENYRELLLRVPAKQVPWTKENVVPITTEYSEAKDFWYFKTPDGNERIPKKDYRATDFLDDNNKGKIVFGDEDDAESLIEATSQEGLGEWLSAIDYGRADGKSVLHFDNVDADKLDRLKRYAEIWDGKLSAVDGDAMPPKHDISQEEALEKVLAREQPDPKPRFTGGHWEESDVIAHIRFNERVDPDGNKVLFIEEIQSDWAHKGKDIGFKGPETEALRTRLENIKMEMNRISHEMEGISKERQVLNNDITDEMIEDFNADIEIFAKHHNLDPSEARMLDTPEVVALRRKADPHYDKRQELNKKYDELEKSFESLGNEHTDLLNKRKSPAEPIQPGPFVTDAHQWTNLALKRMIRWGSDEGFDSIAWVTGKQSADRYNVRKLVDQVTWNPKTNMLSAFKGINTVLHKTVPESELTNVVGKDIANKLLKGTPEDKAKVTQDWKDGLISSSERDALIGTVSVQGDDLEIGGEYHKFIYDKVITDQAKKIGKKHGAKVEEGNLTGKVGEKPEPSRLRYEVWDEEGSIDAFETREAAENALETEGLNYGTDPYVVDSYMKDLDEWNRNKSDKVWTMRLTDKLKEASREGLPYYMVLPPLVIGGAAAQRTDAQKQQAKTDAQAILAQ